MSKFLNVAKKWGPVIMIAFVLLAPLMVDAQALDRTPLTEEGVKNAIKKVADFLIIIGVTIAVLWIIFAGFKYLFAGGDPEAAGKARTMLWNGIIGLLIIVGAWLIVTTVITLVGSWLGRSAV